MHARKKYIIDVFGREPESLDDLAKCVISVINRFDNRDIYSKKKVSHGDIQVLGFAWDIYRKESVSNSHCSLLSGQTNWGQQKDNAPVGYPGWQGRVWIRLSRQPHRFGSDVFNKTLTYVGTGGAGSYDGPWSKVCGAFWKTYGHNRNTKNFIPHPECYSWYYKIFEDDWPLLKEYYQQESMWSKLSDKSITQRHHFKWEDSATIAKDIEFMKWVESREKDKKSTTVDID